MERTIVDEGLLAFSEVDVVPEFEGGVISAVQANGIAGLQSNTVMSRLAQQPERSKHGCVPCVHCPKWARALLLPGSSGPTSPDKKKRIDLWWGGLQNNGDMMLLLAHLLILNPEWTDARLLIRSIARNEKGAGGSRPRVLRLFPPEVRIAADTDIIMGSPEQDNPGCHPRAQRACRFRLSWAAGASPGYRVPLCAVAGRDGRGTQHDGIRPKRQRVRREIDLADVVSCTRPMPSR